MNPSGETDATGRLSLEGVWPGRYRVAGALRGAETSAPFVLLQDGDQWSPQIEIRPKRDSTLQVAARVAPSSSISARLRCMDGGRLPSVAAVRAWPADTELPSWSVAIDEAPAALVMDRAVLSAPERNALHAAPLTAGAHRLAVRPTGFDRWTWLPGVEDPAAAEAVEGELGATIDVGELPIDCGPAVRIALMHNDGRTVGGFWNADEVSVRRSGSDAPMDGIVADALGDAIVLRGLKPGDARLVIDVANGYLLPDPTLTVDVNDSLRRGRTVDIAVTPRRLGGMLLLHDSTAGFARISGDGGEQILPLHNGTARFANLVAGTYAVASCADSGCSSLLQRWDTVTVEAARTTMLPPTAARAIRR